jgi:hypothetical protein
MENNVIADSGQQDDTKKGLDNTSHPGRPGSDELVPSRYALRVGKIDVLVVSGLAGGHVPSVGHARLAAERSRGA